MPCFKGLAVSIHTPDGPLPEYSIVKQSRVSRISSYIPVPPPKLPTNAGADGNRPEQSTFAISITLLTPGLNVPYSSPKPTTENPYPQPKKVSSLPSITGERGRYGSSIAPYLPLTTSPNETIAAYIYFDGRPKEEVATLLRRGEETWVNSRWVSVPELEGGGLAEREFLFREVGLERWLNGLDLDGKDAAAKIEKRRLKMERKRRRRKIKVENSDEEEGDAPILKAIDRSDKGVMRYGADAQSPLEHISDSDDLFDSGSDDSDDDPIPESTGQIKVALYRVLASGDIRRGEYSPQFDAHEGDEDGDRMEGDGGDKEEIDHTTSFAKPKTLDPKSISTQTVTGIDPQERPFAVFTYLYRGEKQLHKMGILQPASKPTPKTPQSNGKRRSIQEDLSKMKPLNSDRLKLFSTMRDPDQIRSEKASKRRNSSGYDDSDDDIDADDTVIIKAERAEEREADAMLSPEEARKQGELAEGVQKIRLKRQHSFDDDPTIHAASPAPAAKTRHTPPHSHTPSRASPPPDNPFPSSTAPAPHAATPSSSQQSGADPPNGPLLPSVAFSANTPGSATTTAADAVGSPLKKARSSLSAMGEHEDEEMRKRFGLFTPGGSGISGVEGSGPDTANASTSGAAAAAGAGGGGLGLSGVRADVLGNIEHDRLANSGGGGGGGVNGVENRRTATAGSASLGGLLGGLIGQSSQAGRGGSGEVKKEHAEAATGKEIKMEEEEEL